MLGSFKLMPQRLQKLRPGAIGVPHAGQYIKHVFLPLKGIREPKTIKRNGHSATQVPILDRHSLKMTRQNTMSAAAKTTI